VAQGSLSPDSEMIIGIDIIFLLDTIKELSKLILSRLIRSIVDMVLLSLNT